MPRICYVPKDFRGDSLLVIDQANRIIDEYLAQGFQLTLRQLYYQFVARGLLANKQKNYKRLGSIVNDARLAGLIDWRAIEDRTRNLAAYGYWSSPEEIIEETASAYAIDKWAEQPVRVEVWIEKEALAGVFSQVCRELDVPYLSCRGYTSQSEMWAAAMRLQGYTREGKDSVILHFGDHDPSGIDMTRDIRDRLALFGCDVEVRRLALNMAQVEAYNPPPNPAKTTDSRFNSYIMAFGTESWELDALDPPALAALVRGAIEELRDEDLWEDAVEREEAEKSLLARVSDRWADVREMLMAE